jgi:hypothetical protein
VQRGSFETPPGGRKQLPVACTLDSGREFWLLPTNLVGASLLYGLTVIDPCYVGYHTETIEGTPRVRLLEVAVGAGWHGLAHAAGAGGVVCGLTSVGGEDQDAAAPVPAEEQALRGWQSSPYLL